MDVLYERGIYVFLDFHQDLGHEVYGGDGFPDWALPIDEGHPRPTPAGFRNKKWYLNYLTNESLKHTYESFWKNDLTNKELSLNHFPVRTHIEKPIGQTVKFFKSFNEGLGHPSIIGVEAFNEPQPGLFSDQDFETNYLFPYYRNVNSEIRKFDDSLFILFEPQVIWDISLDPKKTKDPQEIKTYLPENLSVIDNFGENGVLSFHYYDEFSAGNFVPENTEKYEGDLKEIFKQLALAATKRGLVPFLTEFGGNQESGKVREHLNIVLNQIESNFLNFTIWNYNLYNTEEGKDGWNFENFSLVGPNNTRRNIDVVARPYPMRSSAEPFLLFFDINSKHASIMLKGKVYEAPTIIYIPYNIHYSPEFTVWATSSNEMRWDKDNFLLYWYPAKNEEISQIIIAPGRKYNTEVLPSPSKDMISRTTFSMTYS
jgi:endoglycosylceramidase